MTIDRIEHLDVIIVGAGLSGIGAAHHVQASCPWASYAVLEARGAMGGTWDLFRYPGIRSDSDMYTLGYSFRPWREEKSIADGPAILQYIKDTAAEYGIDRKIRYNHRILSAAWSTDDANWLVTAERTDTDTGAGELVQLTCNFLFSCSGYYRYDKGYQPDFAGMDDFAGQIIHPQHWPEDLDYAGKKVVVIGSGATAVTLIPSMADKAAHVTMLQRSPTYIAPLPAKDPIARTLQFLLPKKYSGKAIKWFKAITTQWSYEFSKKRPETMRKFLRKVTQMQLPEGYDMRHFTPKYDPWDQRLCVVPDGDLFKAIKQGSASVVTDHVATFTETGVALESGEHLDADIIVTATGLELLFIGGIDITVDGAPVELPELLTYKGMMLEDIPNLALAIGYTNASWTLKCDLTCEYVTRLLNHMHDTGLRQATARNIDGSVSPEPLLGLSSGYVQRSQDKFPKQGSRFPWQVHQSYLKDYKALKRASIVDDAMQFTNPAQAKEPAPV